MAIKGLNINKKLLTIVLSISIIKVVSLFFINQFNTFEDYEIAQNFTKHHIFFYLNDGALNHSFQFPIYPLFLSITFSIYNAPIAAALLNIILLSSSSLLLYSLLKKCRKWEWITLSDNKMMLLAILPMLHPAFIYYELKCVHPFTHDFLFVVLSLYTCLTVLKEKNTALIEKGLVLGLCILARGTFIVFPLIVLVFICFKKEIKKAAFIALGIAMMLSPWLIHNYLNDEIIGLTSTSGKILWKGSLHDSEGGNYLNNGENYYSSLSAEDLNVLGKSSVKEQNDFFMKRYKAQWKNEPLHVLNMLAIKMKNFWFYSPNMGKEYPSFVKKALPFIRLINLIFVVSLLFLSFKNRQIKWIMIALAFSFLQCIFYFEARHRILIEPLLIIIFTHLLYSYFKKNTIA
ncbi:MAG: hypothetical protein ACO3EE_10870 [Flavobacteriales bacterium]